MANLKNLLALAKGAGDVEDQTVVVADFQQRLAAAGKTVGRFIQYIELGLQPGRPNKHNKNPKPAEEVWAVFELLGPKNVRTETVDGKEVEFADRVAVRLKKKFSGKADFKKLFEAMRYGRDNIKHMAQMLGEAFVITVEHNTNGEGEAAKTYANIKNGTGWLIGAPYEVDAITNETKKYKVRAPVKAEDIKLFLWNNPTDECWDSLFIDGSRTKKDAKGNDVEVSKNWMQETILKALNFEGSAVQEMLGGVAGLPQGEGSDMADALAADTEEEVPFEAEVETETEETSEEEATEELEVEAEPEPAPKPKAAAKKPAAKAPAKPAPTKAPAKAEKAAAKPATKPAAKTAAKAPPKADTDDVLAALGLDD